MSENCSTLLNWWTRNIPRVSRPGRARLAAEARRERDVAERQLVGGEDLARVEARDRDLRRSGEVEAVGRELVDVRLVGRERARADQRLLAHEHRREHRDEPLRREPVEREAVEREREPRGVPDPVPEARAGHPRRALHVEAPDLEVVARLGERGRLADAPHLADVVLGGAVRNVVVREVRDAQRERVALRLRCGELVLGRLELGLDAAGAPRAAPASASP